MSDFFNDFALPDSTGGNYTKLEPGQTRLRIASKPTIGLKAFTLEGKPERWPSNEHRTGNFKEHPRNFIAFKVYNHTTAQVEVLEISQRTIIAEIINLTRDVDWGDPRHYDVTITRSGDGMNTKYSTKPHPHAPLKPAVIEQIKAIEVDCTKLFEGESPFVGPDEKLATRSPHQPSSMAKVQEPKLAAWDIDDPFTS